MPVIQEIAWHTWEAAYGQFIPQSDRRFFHDAYYALDKLRNLYTSKVVEGCVALVNEEIVGYSKTFWNDHRNEFYITSLYVLPQFQKLGLGKMMLNYGMQAAQKYGVDRIWLGVMIDNKPAVDWYRRQGFSFVENRPFTIGKTTIDDLIGFKLI